MTSVKIWAAFLTSEMGTYSREECATAPVESVRTPGPKMTVGAIKEK